VFSYQIFDLFSNKTFTSLTTEDVEAIPMEAAASACLLVPQAIHLSSVDVLVTIQVEHSHDPLAGLNFCDNSDYKKGKRQQITIVHIYVDPYKIICHTNKWALNRILNIFTWLNAVGSIN